MLRRIEIETDNVLKLGLEVFVIGKLEPLDSMRLKPVGRLHPTHTRRTDPNPIGHRGPAPVCGAWRLFLERQFYDARLDCLGKRADASWPGFIFEDRFQPAPGIAASPPPHLQLVLSEPPGDLSVLQSIGRKENDGGAFPGTHRARSPSANRFQLRPLLTRQFDDRGHSHAQRLAPAV